MFDFLKYVRRELFRTFGISRCRDSFISLCRYVFIYIFRYFVRSFFISLCRAVVRYLAINVVICSVGAAFFPSVVRSLVLSFGISRFVSFVRYVFSSLLYFWCALVMYYTAF